MKNPYYISVYKILEWCKILENVNQLIMTADQWLPGESMVGGALEGDVRKEHEESFGFHGCVHYLDPEDVFMG